MEGSPLSSSPEGIGPDEPIHRIGGAFVENFALKPEEATLEPPGISTLRGGTPAEAAETMRKQFPRMAPRGSTVVGTALAAKIREAGFDVIMKPTRRFPRHARLVHPAGVGGFSQENLERLVQCFQNRTGL